MSYEEGSEFDISNLAVDLSQTQLPDEGEYKIRIDSVKGYKAAPSEANPQGLRMVTITATIFGSGDPVADGKKIFQRDPLEGAGAFRTKQVIKAFELGDPDSTGVQQINYASIVNRSALVAVKHDTSGKDKGFEARLQISRWIEALD